MKHEIDIPDGQFCNAGCVCPLFYFSEEFGSGTCVLKDEDGDTVVLEYDWQIRDDKGDHLFEKHDKCPACPHKVVKFPNMNDMWKAYCENCGRVVE